MLLNLSELQTRQQAYKKVLMSIKREMQLLQQERKTIVKNLTRLGEEISKIEKLNTGGTEK